MENKTKGWLFKLPLILLLLATFIASIYAAVKHLSGINYATPILVLIIIALYIVGEYFANKKGYW